MRVCSVIAVVITSVAAALGCDAVPSEPAAFGPASVNVSSAFSRVVDGRLEADVELVDAAGDSTKGAGVLILSLYEYEVTRSRPVGERVAGPERIDLSEPEAQARSWQRVSRTYGVNIDAGGAEPGGTYLLYAAYTTRPGATTRPGGPGRQRRFFDTAVLRPVADGN